MDNMDYETRMALEAKKKKKNQFITLIFVIILLLGALYLFYNWQQGNGKKKFERLAEETLKSVNENYKNDKMMDSNLEDQTFHFPDKSIINFTDLYLKGGTIIQYGNGDVSFVLYDDKWCATKEKNSSHINVKNYNKNNCTLPN